MFAGRSGPFGDPHRYSNIVLTKHAELGLRAGHKGLVHSGIAVADAVPLGGGHGARNGQGYGAMFALAPAFCFFGFLFHSL